MDDKKLLSINDVQRILGISYPTALNRARAYGVFVDTPPSGKWFFDPDIIRQQLNDEIDRAKHQLKQINEVVNHEPTH